MAPQTPVTGPNGAGKHTPRQEAAPALHGTLQGNMPRRAFRCAGSAPARRRAARRQ